MQATKSESSDAQNQSFQQTRPPTVTTENLSQHTHYVNSESLTTRFISFLERHVDKLRFLGPKARGLCPLHAERTPSFSANVEKGVWYCFGCGRGGGVKDFALAIGEQWVTQSAVTTHATRRERACIAVQLRRREAEAQARAILQQRKDERDNALWSQWIVADTEASSAAELLALFFRRPDLEMEFSDLAERTEREYADVIHRRVMLEAQLDLDGEVL